MHDYFNKLVGQEIRKARLRKGWSQRQLTAKRQAAGCPYLSSASAKLSRVRGIFLSCKSSCFSRYLGMPLEELFPEIPVGVLEMEL